MYHIFISCVRIACICNSTGLLTHAQLECITIANRKKRKCSLLTLLVLHVWVFVLHSQMYSYTCVLPNPTTRRQKNTSALDGGIYQGCQNPWIYQQYNKITKVFQTITLGHNHITYRKDRVSISHLDLVQAERKREISWPCAWRFTNCPTNEFLQ